MQRRKCAERHARPLGAPAGAAQEGSTTIQLQTGLWCTLLGEQWVCHVGGYARLQPTQVKQPGARAACKGLCNPLGNALWAVDTAR